MNTHRIHRVAKLTGLSRDVIRVWERRYGIIKPERGANRYRLYTDEDVALLRYLKKEMEAGTSIGELAATDRDDLLSRVRGRSLEEPIRIPAYERLLGELTAALAPLDKVAFERRLNGAVAVVPFEEALHGILLPLQQRVGQLWHEGRLDAALEHYVTHLVQQKLFAVMNQLSVVESGPKIIVACPPGEEHEIGALSAAYLCAARGCRVYYLGANLPLDALERLCSQVRPDLLLLSLTLVPMEDAMRGLADELMRRVGAICSVIAGGAGASAMRAVLERAGLIVLDDFEALQDRVRHLIYSRSPVR